MRDHLMVGCDSLKVVILVRIQVPQLIEFVTKLRLDKFYQLSVLNKIRTFFRENPDAEF